MVLKPYLAEREIHITPVSVGGKINLDRIRNELKNLANNFEYVTTFYDFYGFKGVEEAETKQSLEQKIKAHAHKSIQTKLIPYVQMYEYEGLLFTSPEAIHDELMATGMKKTVKEWSESVLTEFSDNPEKINNSEQTAPSKRLEKYTNYRKTTHGPNIAKAIGIDELRRKCTNFDSWLRTLESLV